MQRLSTPASTLLTPAFWLRIFSYCNLDDLSQLALVSREFSKISKTNSLWEEKVERHFPNPYGRIKDVSTHWFSVFKSKYKHDYRRLSPRDRRLYTLVKDNNIPGLKALNELPFDFLSLQGVFTTPLLKEAYRQNNQALLDCIYELMKNYCQNRIAFLSQQKEVPISYLDTIFPPIKPKEGLFYAAIALLQPKETLLELINEGVNVNADFKGSTPLQLAAEMGHLSSVKMLLEHGANVSTRYGVNNPLYLAISQGHTEIVSLLLEREDVVPQVTSYEGQQALCKAVEYGHFDTVNLLFARPDANGQMKNRSGETLLHIAIPKGYVNISQLLISRKEVDVNAEDRQGKTPLHLAVEQDLIEIVEPLLQREDLNINAVESSGKTVFDYVNMKNTSIIKLLFGHKNIQPSLAKNGWTLFHYLSNNGCTEEVKSLFARDDFIDAAANTHNSDGNTPLHLAARWGHIAVVTLLLAHNADPNDTNEKGETALHLATEEGHTEVVELLIEHHANINAPDNKGWTPLHFAVRGSYLGRGDHKEIIKLFLQHKNIMLNLANEKGETALHTACTNGHCDAVELLCAQKNLAVNAVNKQGMTPFHAAVSSWRIEIMTVLLKREDIDVNIPDNEGNAPIHTAIELLSYRPEPFRLLMYCKNLDINVVDAQHATPLFSCISQFYVYQTQVRWLLLRDDINVNIPNVAGWTPLHFAVKNGDVPNLKLLLEHKPNLHAVNYKGVTVFDMIQESNRAVIEPILLQYQASIANENADIESKRPRLK